MAVPKRKGEQGEGGGCSASLGTSQVTRMIRSTPLAPALAHSVASCLMNVEELAAGGCYAVEEGVTASTVVLYKKN